MKSLLSLRLQLNSTRWKKINRQIQLHLLLLSCFIIVIDCACSFSPYCDPKCLNKMCVYDPSTNSYYNSSISNTSPGYHGQGCCTGCEYPYSYDHAYNSDPLIMGCYRKSCTKDSNGVQRYWRTDETCGYDCPFGPSLCMNPFTGTCEYYCSTGYYRLNSTKSCVSDCPAGLYKYQRGSGEYDQRQCKYDCKPFYANNDTGLCQEYCTTGYADPVIYLCTNSCSAGYYKVAYNLTLSNSTTIVNKKCATKADCYNIYQRSFSNNQTNTCQKNCSGGLYGDQLSGYCIATCPNNTYIYEQLKVCVQSCTFEKSGLNIYLDLATNTCQATYNNYYSFFDPSGSSNISFNVNINQTVAIVIGIGVFALIAGLIVWNIQIMLKMKRYIRVPIRGPQGRIDVDFNA